jgi:hypothetical protein
MMLTQLNYLHEIRSFILLKPKYYRSLNQQLQDARHRHARPHALTDQLLFGLRVIPAPTIALEPNNQPTQYLCAL